MADDESNFSDLDEGQNNANANLPTPKMVYTIKKTQAQPGVIVNNMAIFEKDALKKGFQLLPNQNIGKLIAQTPSLVQVEYFNKSTQTKYNWLVSKTDVKIK